MKGLSKIQQNGNFYAKGNFYPRADSRKVTAQTTMVLTLKDFPELATANLWQQVYLKHGKF